MGSTVNKLPAKALPVVLSSGQMHPTWYEFFRQFGVAAIEDNIFDTTDFDTTGDITIKDSGIDHDATTNYVANEHIDWTSTSSNLSTSGTAATGALTVTGNIGVTGNVDGRDLASDGNKLDTISDNADVTTTALASGIGTGTFYGDTITLNDDAATSFTPDKTQGAILVTPQTSAASAVNALVAYGALATSYTAIMCQSGTTIEATTGALAGTTGNDNKLTISAHTDNKIYIENRTGATITISYTLLGT